jgi:hypothetical protein
MLPLGSSLSTPGHIFFLVFFSAARTIVLFLPDLVISETNILRLDRAAQGWLPVM